MEEEAGAHVVAAVEGRATVGSLTGADLVKHSAAGEHAPQLVKELLGNTWSRWFRGSCNDADVQNCIVARQAVYFLYKALDSLREQYKISAQAEAKAREATKSIHLDAKRRRCAEE